MLSVKDIDGSEIPDATQLIASQASAKMAADLDAALRAAIKDYLGIKELDVDSLPSILRGRMVAAHMPDGSTEYRIDDHPILRVGPVRIDLRYGRMYVTKDMLRMLSAIDSKDGHEDR